MKKRYCKLDVYNRLLTIKEMRKQLAEIGAVLLMPKYYEKYEMEVYTNDTDTDKVKKLKDACKNIIVLRDDCGEGLSLQFIYGNAYYYISYDENPFMPITYCKIIIDENGNYTGARYYYSNEDLNNKSWAKNKTLCFSFGYDDFFKICTNETIKECALYHLEQIKKEIFNGRESEQYTDCNHPRNKQYNIYESYLGDRYGLRPMTKEEIEL